MKAEMNLNVYQNKSVSFQMSEIILHVPIKMNCPNECRRITPAPN